MDINFTKEDIAFRDEVRNWLANDYPKHVKEKTENGIALTKQDMIDYHKAISKKGWMGYNWPVEYGGTCLLYTSPSPRDRYISRMPSSA